MNLRNEEKLGGFLDLLRQEMNENKVLIGWRTFTFPRIFGISILDTKVAVRVLSG